MKVFVVAQGVAQGVAHDVAQDVAQDAAQKAAQDAAQDVAQDAAQDVAEDVVQDLVHRTSGGAAQSASMSTPHDERARKNGYEQKMRRIGLVKSPACALR